jgi:predicted ester cyclase
VTLFRTGFPDIHFTTDEIIGEGDSVVVRYTYRGTHTAVFAGIEPTGHSIAVMGILIAHLEGGRIREAVSVFDSADLMKQLTN